MTTTHNYSSFSRISVATTMMATKDNTELQLKHEAHLTKN
jgi:hypothetical protein